MRAKYIHVGVYSHQESNLSTEHRIYKQLYRQKQSKLLLDTKVKIALCRYYKSPTYVRILPLPNARKSIGLFNNIGT